jgi:cardiolipin synthase
MKRGWRKYILPNLFTLLRLFAAGGAAFIFQSSLPHRFQWFVAGIIFAGITDAIDGPLARRFEAESRLGGWFDHVVDAFLLGVLFAASYGLIEFNILKILMLLQSLTAAIGCFQAMKKAKEVWPNDDGKISVVFLIVAICLRVITLQTPFQEWGFCVAHRLALGAIAYRFISLWRYWKWFEENDLLC